ncbi:MAG: tetratricopeptide repeat protein [Planctomycetes bacterium]|nr:tetratricopeptide repeat protein [Planctomycetota bacterium]
MNKPRRSLWAVLALALISLPVLLDDPLEQGENALIARQYQQAVGFLEQALQAAPADRQDDVLLLLGRARWLAGDLDAAVATYQRLCADHPDSRWADKAALQQAEALSARGRHREAAEVYRRQIARLTGPERKQEIAATYLGLADKALAEDPPQYARAAGFYDLAVGLGLADAKARNIRLLAAEAELRAGQYPSAAGRFEPLVAELSRDEGRLRAMLGLGRARLALGAQSTARDVFRDLIAVAPDSPEAADASWEIVQSFGVPQPAPDQLDRALAALRAFATEHPDHPKARIADYLAAASLLHCGRSEAGLEALRRFLAEHGDDVLDEVPTARARVGDVLFAQGRLTEAIDAWRTYLAAHPSHSDWVRVQAAIVDAEFQRAEAARIAEDWGGAAGLYEAFMAAHPLDGRNARILVVLGDMLRTQERYDDAVAAYGRCVSKYPGRDESSEAQLRIGEIHERDRFDYQRALDAYRAVTWGPFQPEAQQRIARLEQKSMRVQTPRTFRSGETAHFVLTSRNIEQVRVRVWKLDLETWFRATHLPGTVDRLDVEVIEPDRTFDSGVDDFIRFRETERQVPIGFGEPGCYVVKVDDKELETTTMVLVTDLALIVKTSRHELLAFVQDLARDAPASGARVVVSDGQRIVAEGRTGDDGVWTWTGKELQTVAQLSAFAVDDRGSAAGTLGLDGLGYAEGLTPKAYTFTDRPAYRPGDVVQLKGIVREVRGGVYALPGADSRYRLRIVTPGGRAVVDQAIELSDFGSFALEYPLSPDAELGGWRATVAAEGRGGQAWSAGFTVADFVLPALSVDIETDQRVVFRGEKIAGRVVVRHFYGDPAVGRAVRIEARRPNGESDTVSGTTNAAGELRFEFGTEEFREESIAFLAATVAGEASSAMRLVPVVTTALQIEVAMLRDVYLAREPFDAEVTVRDRSGEPVAAPVRVELFRRERRKGGIAEVRVAEASLRTTAERGQGRAGLAAERGGEHVIRVAVEDRRGQLVTAECAVQISGDDDEIKLRLLSDRESARVGETLRVRVVSRCEGPRLALRTLQADGILAHAVLRIPPGESELALPLTTEHAPNFGLALALVDGTELRTAQRDFTVSRDLRIEIDAPSEPARPGETVKLPVRTLTADGRPVAAEVAIALVDQALLRSFPDATPPIGPYFFGQLRETAFRTASSAGWSMSAGASKVPQELLAEDARRAEAAAHGDPGAPATNSDDFFMGTGVRNDAQNAPVAGGGGGRRPGRSGPATPGPAGPSTPGPATGGPAGPGGQGPMLADGRQVQAGFLGLDAAAGQWAQRDVRARPEQLFAQTLGPVGFDVFSIGAGDGELGLIRLPNALPRVRFASDGAWLSAVRTGADGRAEVELTMPPRAGGWSLVARGVTTATDVGEQRAELRTAEAVVVDLQVPPFLVEGDRTSLRGAVHARGATGAALDVAWTVGADTARESVRLAAGEERALARELAAAPPGELQVALATTGDAAREARRTIPVRPFGAEQRTGAAGVTDGEARARLALPVGRSYGDLDLRVEIGPDPARSLVAAALGEGLRPSRCLVVDRTNVAVALRGLAAAHVLARTERVGGPVRSDVGRLEAAVDAAVAQLLAVQGGDGSFAWVGRGDGDLRASTAALRLLAAARSRGSNGVEEALTRTADWLLAALRSVRDERATIEPWRALAEAGRGRFEALNALHRRRGSLTPAELARLALAWHVDDRGGRVGELAEPLGESLGALLGSASPGPEPVEQVALIAQALLAAGDASRPQAQRAIAWLEEHRRGASWGSAEADEAAVAALCAAGGGGFAAADDAVVDVLVDGKVVRTVARRAEAATEVVSVGAADLAGRPAHDVAVRVRGRARVHWSAVLTGYADGFVTGDRNRELAEVVRHYGPDFLREDGKRVSPGFDVVTGETERFSNDATAVRVGEVVRAEVRFAVRDESLAEPLVVEEPIPAGCTVARASVQGGFQHVEVLSDRIVAYYREGVRIDVLRYELAGRFEGGYRVLPAELYGALRPDRVARSEPGALAVVGRQAEVPDVYRMTPDELYAIGKSAFDRGDRARAGELLGELAKSYTLKEAIARDVARMMLFVSMQAGDSAQVVRWFEELKDRHPDLVIPFRDILAIGDAYVALGEFESAVLVFRATAEASFLEEAKVATTLEQRGATDEAVAFLRDLLLTYPDLNTIRQSLYGVGQKLGLLAAKVRATAAEPDVAAARERLYQRSMAAFRQFLVLYPDDPLAPEVSFSWATTAIEKGDLAGALAIAEGALQRYPESTLEDEFLYTVGFVRFALGEAQPALAALQRVATETFVRPGGGRGPSENRQHAIYLEGQVHHARGEIAQALAEYDRVVDAFADAGEAAEYFRRKDLALDEVTTLDLAAEGALQLRYRNLERIDLSVYRVDLMRLYLLHKSLADIRDVMLHGIRPHHAARLTLEGEDFVDHVRRVELPVDEPGAYLVVVRAGDRIASGMVLRTSLALEVQEDLAAGRVRVNVRRGGSFASDVHVKVVGSGDGRIRSGDTDLRGVFATGDVVGRATVLARLGDEFAFFRGTGIHQPERFRPAPVPQARPQQQVEGQTRRGREFDAWENNFRMNDENRARQVQWLEDNVLQQQQREQGVQVLKTR